MQPPDPRDTALIDRATAAVLGLVLAVHGKDNQRVVDELHRLLVAVVDHRDAWTERPSDEPLRAAVARLNAGGQHSAPVAE